jgi:uncharacterized membrane protein
LESQGKIRFSQKASTISASPSKYVLSARTAWFWTTAILAIATVIAVFTVPEDAYPLVYVRYVLGIIFVLWLPGYTFIKALFPTQVPIKTSSSNLDTIERVALSAGMSLALVPLVGLILNYTPWGIRLTPIVISLSSFTVGMALVALARQYRMSMENAQLNVPVQQ